MAANRLRWIVRRVWVTDDDGTKRRGTLWSVYGDSVKIRVGHVPGVAMLPAAARGTRWDFVEIQDRAPDQ
jgi:hypothetical protein